MPKVSNRRVKDPVTPLAIPPKLRAQLYESAAKQGRTLSGHIIVMLYERMQKEFGK